MVEVRKHLLSSLRAYDAVALGAPIGADARGLSAILVVSGTFGDEFLEDHHSVAIG
jgi:hypothetical protein